MYQNSYNISFKIVLIELSFYNQGELFFVNYDNSFNNFELIAVYHTILQIAFLKPYTYYNLYQ